MGNVVGLDDALYASRYNGDIFLCLTKENGLRVSGSSVNGYFDFSKADAVAFANMILEHWGPKDSQSKRDSEDPAQKYTRIYNELSTGCVPVSLTHTVCGDVAYPLLKIELGLHDNT